jgi:hypothetical protein
MTSTNRVEDYENLLLPLLPATFRSANAERPLQAISSYFFSSFETAGDICEFGCFPHTMSRTFAFVIAALGVRKNVYAFDTFGGGDVDSDGHGSSVDLFDELTKWAAVLPVRAIRGDATETCKLLIDKVSLAWFNLDAADAIDSVLQTIWPLLGTPSIIGIDHIGDPATPELEAWTDKMVADGRLALMAKFRVQRISFFRPVIA